MKLDDQLVPWGHASPDLAHLCNQVPILPTKPYKIRIVQREAYRGASGVHSDVSLECTANDAIIARLTDILETRFRLRQCDSGIGQLEGQICQLAGARRPFATAYQIVGDLIVLQC